jgi:acyl-CoA synthetase (NDP forming)
VSAAINFDAFVRPRSIAVVGATERPDTWGNWLTRKLIGEDFSGTVYPINPRAQTIFGQPAYPTVSAVPEPVDLAIIAIPAAGVFEAIRDCAAKQVPAGLIITAGFSEARSDGLAQEQEMVTYARAHGLRLIGPNVSGIMNLHAGLVAHPAERQYLCQTPITFICQGAYAITDIAAREASARRGFGKFLHTGNEADVTVADCLEYCETDPETQGICLYIEGLRDARRFVDIARRLTPHKPIVVFKAGLTPDGSRAAASHTGALAGSADMYRGIFRQAGMVQAPTFELSLNLAHALIEMPPLRQPTIGIATLGGSWGVMLTDALGLRGLRVPELPVGLQDAMRRLGMPERASVRNPVDFGAAAGSVSLEARMQMVDMLLACETIGGVVVHGYGAPGFLPQDAPAFARQRLEEEKAMIRSVQALQETRRKPVVLASIMTPLESQVVRDMLTEGIRLQHRLDDVAAVMAALYDYATMHGTA